ncbi:MAG: AMP-binding protein [Actinomycetota bacterium]|nr:AMP-binding protein [Actinomycetota bacterium]
MLAADTIWRLIEKRAAETPDATTAVDERGESLTFAALQQRAEETAAGLAAMGVGKGTVVSWQLPTWIDSVVLVGALCRLGALQNPILPIYREREVGFIAKQAATRLLIVPSEWRGFEFEAMARGIAKNTDGLDVLVCDRELPAEDPSTLLDASPASDAVRWLFYTSGTTADPKGAQHTDKNLVVTAAGMSERLALVSQDRSALVFPFTHIGGITWMVASLLIGFTNLLDEAFDPVKTVEMLQRENVTIAGSGTFFHLAYLKAQRENPSQKLFPKARCYPGGGATKPPQIHYDVKKELGGAGVVSGYGLTESPILTMASVDDPDDALALSEGRPMAGVELKLVTLDGRIAGPNEEGEVRAKAPQMMKGYLDSSLDVEAFDEDGYFRTGDLGRLDENGFLAITGRLKDIIIRKGENISAKELEDFLFTHEKVADVAVIGLPDAESGERACAVVVCKDAGNALTFDEMVSFLKGKGLIIQKLPEQLEIVDALPRNPAGKVVKMELRTRFGV